MKSYTACVASVVLHAQMLSTVRVVVSGVAGTCLFCTLARAARHTYFSLALLPTSHDQHHSQNTKVCKENIMDKGPTTVLLALTPFMCCQAATVGTLSLPPSLRSASLV